MIIESLKLNVKSHSIVLLVALVALLLSTACGHESREEQIAEAMSELTERYPAATLQDIYKSCFQDHFGVAHMLGNRGGVKGYIEHELATAEAFDEAYYEPCGWQGRFVRVNLAVVRDGLMTIDELTDAFMASAEFSSNEVTEAWIGEWHAILEVLRAEGLHEQLPDFAADSARLEQMLSEGRYVMHHSASFRDAYHPHYRIIHRSIFEERILPNLK